MLRDKNLIPLSHQHQRALALCVQIERSLDAGKADLSTWQPEIELHYSQEIKLHFAAEEQVLFQRTLQLSYSPCLKISLLIFSNTECRNSDR